MSLFETKKPNLESYNKNNPFIQPGQFSDEELLIAELIQRRRLQLLVHSRLYYELNTNLISDKQFDAIAKELVTLQKEHPEISIRICYADAFADWDGTTGAFLPLNDDWTVKKAEQLQALERKRIKNEHQKIFKQSGIQGSKKSERKKASKQRSNSVPKRRCGLF